MSLPRIWLRQGVLALAVAITLQGGWMSALQAQHIAPTMGHSLELPAVEQGTAAVLQKIESGLAAYDSEPLGDRMPLVLVHGIGGTDSRLFHWENFLTFTDRNPAFKGKYKIYLYHYDSTQSVPAISADLQHTLKGFVGALGGRQIKVLAYSEGGLLVRNALQDEYLNQHTVEVLAIATPFHGSPLANPEWMENQAETESPFSVVRWGQKIAYKIAGRKYPTFQQDFHWDNFDGAIPADQYIENNGPVVQKDYALAHKTNFVTYGSYFGTEVDSSILAQELGLKQLPPKEKPMLSNLFKKNFLFSLIRNNIGKLPLAHKAKPAEMPPEQVELHVKANLAASTVQVAHVPPMSTNQPTSGEPISFAEHEDGTIELMAVAEEPALSPSGPDAVPPEPMSVSKEEALQPRQASYQVVASAAEPISMMMYNDGISPISSTLWLGRYTRNFTGVSQPVEKVWAALKSLRGNPNTRLFAGLDHRNWMDGETRTGKEVVQDLLNPQEPSRTVFEWILYDLMS